MKFDCFEWSSSSVWLFWIVVIGGLVRKYVNGCGKYILKVLINLYFNNILNNKQKN